MIKSKVVKNRRYEHIIFEEPLINISMEPTDDVDPLFIDPTAESHNNDDVEDFTINGFSIFSPKVGDYKQKKSITSETKEDKVKVKEEVESDMPVKIKEEPKDAEESDCDLEMDQEEVDPVQALAQALDKVEYLCPKCTFRSTDKQQVTHHLVSSHRVCQIGIPRPCDKCDYVAKTVRELTAHKKSKHPRTFVQDNLPNLPTGEFKCPHCDFTSFHRNNVRSHVRIHTQDTVYTCDKCPYTAISRLNIENHAARHLMKSRRKWKFKCKHCGLLERTEKLLQRHLILHGEGEMLKCQMCPYKSPYSHIITMHTRICHGITGKKSWERGEKWNNVRKSTRRCTRDKKNYTEEKVNNFFELPPKRNRKKKKSLTDLTDTELTQSKPDESTTSELTENKTEEEQEEQPRRPTLEERLGRARDLINKNLSIIKKKDKSLESEKEDEDEDEEKEEEWERSAQTRRSKSKEKDVSDDPTSDEDDNSDDSDGDEGSKSADDWSHNESDLDPAAAHESESLQSSVSDRTTLDSTTNNSIFKDNDNSLTDSESRPKVDITEVESDQQTPIENNDDLLKNSKRCRQSPDDSDSCQQGVEKRLKTEGSPSRTVATNETTASRNSPIRADILDDDSVPAVLVVKRKGTSFTSFLKNNSDSS